MSVVHHQRCVDQAVAHARLLKERVDRGEINAWNCKNLMQGFVDVPAFYPEHRAEIVTRAMAIAGLK